MKKLLTSLLLAGSLALTGCGSSNDDIINQIGNINVNPPVVQGYFVNAATGNDATGSFATGSPYATIQQAVADAAAAGPNNTIIVSPGNYAGTVNLQNGQRLLGSESTLLGGTATTRPILTGNIDMADGNTIDFMAVTGSNVDAILGTGQNAGTVTNCQISNTTGVTSSGVEIDGGTGRWVVSNNTFSNIGSSALFVQGTGNNQVIFVVESNNITGSRGAIVTGAGNTAQVKGAFRGNTFTGSAGVGDAFELACGNTATYCLDLERNTDNGPTNIGNSYRVSNLNGGSTLTIEQLGTLNAAKPGGAANVGVVSILSGGTFVAPVPTGDGGCNPF